MTRGAFGTGPLDCSIYNGDYWICSTRSAGPSFPLATSRFEAKWKFGSRHPGLCQFVFCDGSVRSLANGIDPAILGLLAQVDDGQVVPSY